MRLSAIQKDVLFVLFAIRTKGKAGPVPSMTLLGMINRGRSAEVFPSNFRTSCHTLVDNGLLGKYRDEQLNLGFALTAAGVERGAQIYRDRTGVTVETTCLAIRQMRLTSVMSLQQLERGDVRDVNYKD